MVMNIVIIKSPEEWAITKQACRDESVVFFPISYVYISRSTLTYRALYYEKIETQASYTYILNRKPVLRLG